jgi:superfamily II DNA/RNA helicase
LNDNTTAPADNTAHAGSFGMTPEIDHDAKRPVADEYVSTAAEPDVTTATEPEPAPDSPGEDAPVVAAGPGAESAVPDAIVPDMVVSEAAALHEVATAPSLPVDIVLEPEVVFSELGLSEPILRAIEEMGYRSPTPIQRQAIPVVLMGRDVLGCAQTGTGKTAGFTLPLLDILTGSRARARMPRSLILEPTRELALQVAENFLKYGKYLKLNHALLIGGESMSDQKEALNRGVDVLIATPGRLLDLFERGGLLLTDVKVLVIDEADRMLDMGFIPDVERIVSLLPRTRQTLFFSATIAPEIRRLADAFLQNPKEITVSKSASVATTITERLAMVAEHDKREALRRMIRSEDVQNALIFCNRKRDVDILFKSLSRHNFSVGALHGDMTQPMRFATLEKFKANEIRLLVCSDVAARGLDIGGLSHVFNFDVPHHAEDYVHRIGRTGRAGREGRAFTIATPEDRMAVEAIEKLTGHAIPHFAVEGLDPVEWSEASGRGRRGRRPAAGTRAAPSRGRAAAEPAEAKPPRSRAPRGRSAPAAVSAPGPAEPIAAEAAPPEVIEAAAPAGNRRGRADARTGQRRDAPRESPREAPRPAPRETRETRDAGRERGFPRERERESGRRYRDDDLGPSVVGFGGDVPAFMLIRARRAPVAGPALALEDTESGA